VVGETRWGVAVMHKRRWRMIFGVKGSGESTMLAMAMAIQSTCASRGPMLMSSDALQDGGTFQLAVLAENGRGGL